MANWQELVVDVIHSILVGLTDEQKNAYVRSNGFNNVIREYDERDSTGKYIYGNGTNAGDSKYRWSKNAFLSGLSRKKNIDGKFLHAEHRVPINVIKFRLIQCDGSKEAITKIFKTSEIVLITQEEKDLLDRTAEKGGLRLGSTMPEDGSDRLAFAGIEIASETLNHRL